MTEEKAEYATDGELRAWIMANAMQSKRPEIGEEIIDALAELEQLRIDLNIANGIAKVEYGLKMKYIDELDQTRREYALLQVTVANLNCELRNQANEVRRLKAQLAEAAK